MPIVVWCTNDDDDDDATPLTWHVMIVLDAGFTARQQHSTSWQLAVSSNCIRYALNMFSTCKNSRTSHVQSNVNPRSDADL
jgi:hypothetical protein